MPGHYHIFHVKHIIFTLFVTLWAHDHVDAGAVQLDASNIDSTLNSTELVFINFYAEWCKFSQRVTPLFDQAADTVQAQFHQEPTRVVMGKVDCDREGDIARRFSISKYPTLKLFRGGQPMKVEYRGERSPEAFVKFVEKQLQDPIQVFEALDDLKKLDDKKRVIIGYFDVKETPEYEVFRRVAGNWKDDCQFHVGFGSVSKMMHPPGQPIIAFRPDKAGSIDNDETYSGDLNDYDKLNSWVHDRCVPLVRQITFENAEELTEEGLPFLILFHAPDDETSIKAYKHVINATLKDVKHEVNFLTADGWKFAHPLYHLGKNISDLPVIAIDSFRHMYLFPNFEEIHNGDKLKLFLEDLKSGKLHREFHYGPDPGSVRSDSFAKTPTTPPESTFKKLAPSKNRYTLLRDEL